MSTPSKSDKKSSKDSAVPSEKVNLNLEKVLRVKMEELQDWERDPTSIPSVFIVKIPETKNRPARLAIEINPVGPNGTPTKKNGLFINSKDEIAVFATAINSEKVVNALEIIDKINGTLPNKEVKGKIVLDL